MSSTAHNDGRRTKGVSLAKGPVALIGLLSLIYGISAVILGGHGFALHIPKGAVHGKAWLGLEVNGWSDLLFIAAGLLLLVGAPLHWSAKGVSLLVALVVGAAAVIAVVRGNGVFGIFAANHVTELVWGAGGVVLFVLSLSPRVGGGRQVDQDHDETRRPRRTHRLRRVGPATRGDVDERPDQGRARTRSPEPDEYPERSASARTTENQESRYKETEDA